MGRHAFAIALVAVAFGTTGCAELYGGKPETLAKPTKKKKPPEEKAPEVVIKYVEDCNASFHDPAVVLPVKNSEIVIAQHLADDGNAALSNAKKSADPKVQTSSYQLAIDKLGNALKHNPYSGDLTLQLAKAYDAVYRKGCAIKLLTRLEALSKNPKASPDAERTINLVVDDTTSFKGYRSAATAAVGR